MFIVITVDWEGSHIECKQVPSFSVCNESHTKSKCWSHTQLVESSVWTLCVWFWKRRVMVFKSGHFHMCFSFHLHFFFLTICEIFNILDSEIKKPLITNSKVLFNQQVKRLWRTHTFSLSLGLIFLIIKLGYCTHSLHWIADTLFRRSSNKFTFCVCH